MSVTPSGGGRAVVGCYCEDPSSGKWVVKAPQSRWGSDVIPDSVHVVIREHHVRLIGGVYAQCHAAVRPQSEEEQEQAAAAVVAAEEERQWREAEDQEQRDALAAVRLQQGAAADVKAKIRKGFGPSWNSGISADYIPEHQTALHPAV